MFSCSHSSKFFRCASAKEVGSSVTIDCCVHSFPFVLLAKYLWFGMNSEELPDSRALRKKLEIDRGGSHQADLHT